MLLNMCASEGRGGFKIFFVKSQIFGNFTGDLLDYGLINML